MTMTIKRYSQIEVEQMERKSREKYYKKMREDRKKEDNTRIISLLFLSLMVSLLILYFSIAIFRSLGIGF